MRAVFFPPPPCFCFFVFRLKITVPFLKHSQLPRGGLFSLRGWKHFRFLSHSSSSSAAWEYGEPRDWRLRHFLSFAISPRRPVYSPGFDCRHKQMHGKGLRENNCAQINSNGGEKMEVKVALTPTPAEQQVNFCILKQNMWMLWDTK